MFELEFSTFITEGPPRRWWVVRQPAPLHPAREGAISVSALILGGTVDGRDGQFIDDRGQRILPDIVGVHVYEGGDWDCPALKGCAGCREHNDHPRGILTAWRQTAFDDRIIQRRLERTYHEVFRVPVMPS